MMALQVAVPSADGERSSRLRAASTVIALTVLAGVLTALLFPPYACWWLAPLALVPLLLALRRTATVRGAGYVMLLYGGTVTVIALGWLTHIFGTAVLGIGILISLPWILFGLAYRTLSLRAHWLWLLLMTPVLWVAVDWLRCEGWYFRFSWLQLGVTPVTWPGASVLYPLVGVYGVTFLLVLLNAAFAELVIRVRPWPWLIGSCALGGLVVCGAGWGISRQVKPLHESGAPVKTLLVQAEFAGINVLKRLSYAHPEVRPRLVAWPESAVGEYLTAPKSPPACNARRVIQTLAQDLQATVVVGCKDHTPAGVRCDWLRRRGMLRTGDGELYYNAATIFGPDGTVRGTYHKHYPVQFFADGVPGRTFPTFASPAGRLGVAICYDFDYAQTALQLTRHGAEILVTPTMDAVHWTALQHVQHLCIAQARAAEVQRWVVRPTSSGVTAIIGPDGRVTTASTTMDVGIVTGTVYARTQQTLYTRVTHGVPFWCLTVAIGWACWEVCAVLVFRRTAFIGRRA